ncbi:hypothetical protein AK88_05449 [Plasmodium fragile]|uniref:Uncharacterized protein n=1 Tax=Plasmodium fragile TaxID=5857 RepID=A0A0D9QGR4_PLAFR|nr:uncharacterized protein AK88_05449 [Plasmodium fragile]KJP84916.1 hypothetical protein AK88_05449 [Plasmodium fragile]
MMFPVKRSLFSFILYSWQYTENVNELSTSWNHSTGQNNTLVVRISRLLMGETNVEALLQQNNSLFRKQCIGSVNTNGETYLQDRSDVTKYNDSSNPRSKRSNSGGSSRKKSKSRMDRGNVDKSNESLNLNNFDDHQGKEKFGGSMRFSSMETLLEGRSDHGNDVDQGVSASMLFDSMDSIFEKGADDIFNNKDKVHNSANADSMDSIFQEAANNDDSNRSQQITESMTIDSTDSLFEKLDYNDLEEQNSMVQSSEYHNKDKRLSTTAGLDVDDEVDNYIDKLGPPNELSGTHSGEFFENTSSGKMLRKLDVNVGSGGSSCDLRNKVQGEGTREKYKRFSLKGSTGSTMNGRLNEAVNIKTGRGFSKSAEEGFERPKFQQNKISYEWDRRKPKYQNHQK